LHNSNLGKVRHSPRRLFDIAPWFLERFLKIRRETTADNATAPAMAPNTMPTRAPVLNLDF
jgi:hypothetical protein